MLRTLLLLTTLLGTAAIAASQATPEEILPAGMLLRCTLDEPSFSSQTAQIGDPVLCHLAAVAAFGHSVFPRGAYLSGRFQEYSDPGRLFGRGWIELAFDRLLLPGAVTVPVTAKVISVPHFKVNREGQIRGRGHPKRDAVSWAISVLWPVKVLTLPERGPRPTLKGEVPITLRLLDDVEIPSTVFAPKATSSMPQNLGFKPFSRGAPLGQSSPSGSAEDAVERTTEVPVPDLQRPETVSPRYVPEGLSAPALTWLILKDGTSYLVRDYWFQSGTLQCITLDGERKWFRLTRLDLEETVRLNQERNIGFVIRGQER